MASAVTTPLERQFGQMPSLTQMTSVSSFATSQITLQFDARSQHRRRRAGRAGRDQRRVEPVAADAAGAADLLEVEPGRHAGADARGQLRHAAAAAGRRLRRLGARAEDLAGLGRRPGHASTAGRSRRCACRSIRWRSPAPGSALEDVRLALAAANVNQPKGNVDGAAAGLHHRDQRSDRQGRGLSSRSSSPTRTARRSASPKSPTSSTASRTRSWRAGPASKRAVILNVQRQPGANIIEVTDRDQEAVAAAVGVDAAGHRRVDPVRSHRDGARLGQGRAVHARSSPCCWSCSSSTSFCAASAPPSSPASRCRCRSSPPSASCTCAASR